MAFAVLAACGPTTTTPYADETAETPLAERSVAGHLFIRCSKSGNGTKWGSLETRRIRPFGRGEERWNAFPDMGVSALGEHLLLWDVHGAYPSAAEKFSTEPAYTVRIGDYVFTPPIAQHAYVRARRFAFPPLDLRARDRARLRADERGETYCYLRTCFLSDAEKARLFTAFDRTAAAGGDMIVTGPGPDGLVNVRYSLVGFDGIRERLGICTRHDAQEGPLPTDIVPKRAVTIPRARS